MRPLDVYEVLSTLEGAWALVYYHAATRRIYFARDYFGRRSLLCSDGGGIFELSSVAEYAADDDSPWTEVPSDGIYSIDLSNGGGVKLECTPWVSFTDEQAVKCNEAFREKFNVQHTSADVSPPLRTPMQRRYHSGAKRPLSLPRLQPDGAATPFETLEKYLEDGRPVCEEFVEKLKSSVQKRLTHFCGRVRSSATSASVAVLFSGGIDCTVIALLADLYVPAGEPIDLLNVAFDSGRKPGEFGVPDRLTGLNSVEELRALCPDRPWNFVAVNVRLEELRELRRERIAHLIYPKESVLDDTIACALWFAARGRGQLQTGGGEYLSVAKLLLCGMGADEQLGGYSRHRGVYEAAGKDVGRIVEEIEMEVERISTRNLGRDDRCACAAVESVRDY